MSATTSRTPEPRAHLRQSIGVTPSSDSNSNSTRFALRTGGGQGVSARASTGGHSLHQSQGVFHSAETEAIDRWFEDLSTYEATLEDMAAASLDANFKDELQAIEQWFAVLSEAERTAALYSLLQSATPIQMRFFVTVLQQLAAQHSHPPDSVKSPSSPMLRQFARSSLGPNPNPNSVANEALFLSPTTTPDDHLATQRAKLKASARTSAPANLVLGTAATLASGTGEGLKSPLWSKDETVRERSPSPRPKSTGSTTGGGGDRDREYLRSPALDASYSGAAAAAAENQLSPLVGGNWASMVNTPLVPMFGKNGETMEPGNFGNPHSPDPNLDSLGHRLGTWQNQNQNQNQEGGGGIVLDDVRKFRRSARVSGGALSGMYDGGAGARGGGGDSTKENASSSSSFQSSAATAQKRVQDQLHAVQALKNMQQSALSLGLGSLPSPGLNGSNSQSQQQQAAAGGGGGGSSRVGSSGALNSPGLQQTAMQAQQNWRLQNAPQLAQSSAASSSSSSNHHHHHHHHAQQQHHHHQNNHNQYGHSPNLGAYPNALVGGNDQFVNIGLGTNLTLPSGLGSPASATSPAASASASAQQQAQHQLASLIALQQQMMQQQQQLQTLAGLSPTSAATSSAGAGALNGMGLGGLGMMGTGANLSPNLAALAGQMMGGGHHGHPHHPSQISPRLAGGGGGGGGNNFGLGMGGVLGGGGGMMVSPRRSPRPHDRSPTSFAMTSHRSGNSSAASQSQQLPSGSGSNPDEPLDFALLGDTPAWLRSLRLHKYTPNFDGFGWKDMVKMTDADLEKRGVSALGARRKLTKVFETVRAKTGMSDPPSAPAMDPSTSTDSASPRASTAPTPNSSSNDHDASDSPDADQETSKVGDDASPEKN
ncbi:hypothetical protein JCM11491_002339 [Sporobolomyces phaffii]